MAVTRKNSEMPSLPTTSSEIMEAMDAFGATEANPMPLKEIASTVADTPEAVWDVLSAMEEEGTADLTGRHFDSAWWPVTAPKAPAKPARKRAAKKVATAKPAPVVEPVKAEEPKEETPKPSPKIFKPAPDALPKGTKVTLESGAEATVIADEVVTVKVTSYAEGLRQIIADMTKLRDESSNVRDGYEAPEEVTPPQEPKGVNTNVWNAAHNAFGVSERDTWSARLWYLRKALAQHEAALAA